MSERFLKTGDVGTEVAAQADLGEVANLDTTNKTDLVSAINEVHTNVASISQDNVIIKIFKKSNYR